MIKPSPVLSPVTERQALDAFTGAVAFMRLRGFEIPALLEFADLQAHNTVPAPVTQIAGAIPRKPFRREDY